MDRQRGFMTPMLGMGIALVVASALIYGLWQERERLSLERDVAWGVANENAEEARRQKGFVVAAEVATKRAQAVATTARSHNRRFRRDIEKIATREKPDDPCLQLLIAGMCRATADSLRRFSARVSRAKLPDAPEKPDGAGPGGPKPGGRAGRR